MDEIVRHCVLISSEGHVSDDEKSNYVGEDVLLSTSSCLHTASLTMNVTRSTRSGTDTKNAQ